MKAFATHFTSIDAFWNRKSSWESFILLESRNACWSKHGTFCL